MQSRVRAHQCRALIVLNGSGDNAADRGKGIAVSGNEPQVVDAASVDDARLHAAPEQHAVVGRLPAAAGVEGRSVEHDPVVGGCRDNDRLPFAKRGVAEF